MPNMTWSDQSMHMIMLGNLHKLNDRIPEEDEKEERRLMNFDPADNIALVSLKDRKPKNP